jgi:uncharacterized membrane protein
MSLSISGPLERVLGIVRLRQLADQLRHRLSFVPAVYVLISVVFAQLTLWIDRSIGTVPEFVATNADSARAVFGAIAGGLITAITLVLSMMLVAVQLASSQFSPRTLRDWLSDSVLKHTIGLALGATVFSLLALRSTRSSDVANEELVPDVSVAVAVFFAVLSLLAVVRAVDHITHSLQVGSIAKRLAQDTIRVIDATESVRVDQSPRDVPSAGSLEQVGVGDGSAPQIPHGAVAIEVETSGWVQQIEMTALLEQLPADSTGHVVVPLGGFVPAHAPVMWVSPAPDDVEACRLSLLSAFALGDSRTFQQDVAFGVMQLTDIAVRAMSPGINDPATAADIVVQLGDVMLALWAHPCGDAVIEKDGRRLVRRPTSHDEHLRRSFDPIRRYAKADPQVLSTLVRTLWMIRDESQRRGLPGPRAPLAAMAASVLATADRTSWSHGESAELDRLVAA